jgi:GNAT superfamily N-acetyltransferase
MEIRQAAPSDVNAVARLLVDFNTEFATPTPTPDVLAGRLRGMLQQPTTAVFLVGDPPVGLAVLTARTNVWHDGPVVMLDELYVAPDYRNRRMGSALLAAAEAWALSVGAELVEIDVDGGDVDARRFYERHGYGCVPPGEPEPSLRYFRDLTST